MGGGAKRDFMRIIEHSSPYPEADYLACGHILFGAFEGYNKRVGVVNSVGPSDPDLFPLLTDRGVMNKVKILQNSNNQEWRGLFSDLAAMMLPYMGSSPTVRCVLMLPHADIKGIFSSLEIYDIASRFDEFFLEGKAGAPSTQLMWIREGMRKMSKPWLALGVEEINVDFRDEEERISALRAALELAYHIFCAADKYMTEDSLLGSPYNRGYTILHAYMTAVFSSSESWEPAEWRVQRLCKSIEAMRGYVCDYLDRPIFSITPRQEQFRHLPKDAQYAIVEEAWLTMMPRGWCWSKLYELRPCKAIPITWFESAIPVYIG